ncbi:hypothetical protein ACFC58_36135 [Kitasatospora purpeofusca]|uniref:hypothetical protein n=1 Tax=Kitasatospora purpeofusca TaxID=67352 RepID=UPI0035DCA593
MSMAGGEPMPAPDTDRVEKGRCVGCGAPEAWGYFIADLTPHTALVEHCTGNEDTEEDSP